MRIITEFPRAVREIENVFIPMSDGTRLAARIWLPEDAERDPVPAILEYLPYRKRDGTAERDALTHPYFAGHGYASVRVDIRGSGDSEGVLLGEYLKQEQDDALEIIDWLVGQPWCSGTVGMIGISWGGFNGLQVAARRPPALKAVVSIASTDDRYADDIHFMGGALLLDKVSWGSTIFSINTAPPDPLIVGDAWREMWLERLEKDGLYVETWLAHQRRDRFYKHGSVCEDYSAIEAAVYAVGGWTDGYTNAVFRLLANLECPRKGLVGPWAHKYPHFAKPGPAIGFLQECLRWWDHWLKGRDTGIMDEPMLKAWIQDPVPPRSYNEVRPGRWVAEEHWPSPRIARRRMPLDRGRLALDGTRPSRAALTISSPQTTGFTSGRWCPYGIFPDQPLDQRLDSGGMLVFDSEPLRTDIEILGAPELTLELASDRPQALVAATLSEVLPTGAATRVSYGILNLTHRDGHERPEKLEPGKRYRVKIKLNDAGQRFAKGNRIRLALSTSYWPIVWPSPEPVTLTIFTGASALDLPVRPRSRKDAALPAFPPPECSPPLKQTTLAPADRAWTVTYDAFADSAVIQRESDDGAWRIDHIGLEVGIAAEFLYTIKPEDPLSASMKTVWRRRYGRGDWGVSSETHIELAATKTHFVLTASLEAFEADRKVFEKRWDRKIKRDHV